MTRAIPKGLFPKLDSFRWSVSHLNPGSCEGSEPGSQIFGSDHPKNLALRGTRVGQDSRLWFSGGFFGQHAKGAGRPWEGWPAGESLALGESWRGPSSAVEGWSGRCWLML